MNDKRPRVGLFVTCLVDMMRPSVGFAAVRLLENAGCSVEVPEVQTCCGQPAYNTGDRKTAADLALGVIAAFEPYDFVVAPSGSCGGMIAKHYPLLFAEGSPERARAEAVAAKTHELISFLTDVMGVKAVDAAYSGKVTYHDSCSGLREMDVKAQPRHLLASVRGLELVEMGEPEICCGFGGTFCVKYPQISNDMVDKKVSDAEATGAGLLLAGDLGCLMNMAGKLKRRGSAMQTRHVAEVLAGDLAAPAIAEGEG